MEGKPPDKLRGFKLKSNFKFQAGASGSELHNHTECEDPAANSECQGMEDTPPEIDTICQAEVDAGDASMEVR